MRWVLHNRRFGSYLALAALVLQIVVSFGHVHLYGTHRADHAVAVSGTSVQGSQSLLLQHPGNDGDDDYCPICATTYLTSTSFLPQAPQLPVPFVSRTIQHFDSIAAVFFIAPLRPPFQSRAPPLS